MILVTGGDGLLGRKLVELGAIGTYHSAGRDKNKVKLDITNRKEVFAKIKGLKPDSVVHCAALTDVDYCEDHEKEAWLVNAKGTQNVVDACKASGVEIIYISTDFVFDGKRGRYKEDDIPLPTSVYAITKLVGEYMALHAGSLVCRTSVLYGVHSNKFVPWVIDSLKSKKKIKAVVDQYSSPTLNTELAEGIMKMAGKGLHGIYHTAGSERISRYDFAKNIAKVFSLDEALIAKATSEEIRQRVARPKDSSLDTTKFQKALGYRFSNTKEGLKKMQKEIEEQNFKDIH